MEVEYLIEKLGRHLGGIDVEKVKSALRSRAEGAERILGIRLEEAEAEVEAECRRIRSLLGRYREEERRLTDLYRELKLLGVAPSDLEALKKRMREVRRRIRLYREIEKRCQGRSVSSQVGPQS